MPRRCVRVWTYSSTILDLGIKTEVFGLLHTPTAFTWYLLYKRLYGPHNRSGLCRVEKYFLPLPEIEPRLSNQYPVTIPTELSRFLAWIYKVYYVNYTRVIRNIHIVQNGQFIPPPSFEIHCGSVCIFLSCYRRPYCHKLIAFLKYEQNRQRIK
jgi:hypothetical protein